ncbi:mechanosensitive ion channel family protein [Oleiagrimonas sp. C23AA]|uniref:mechanosensitive ion channel family protein n=1 Tax=Oleiagrimonas sp. C23AA TaxID=2719047 RepID=UPI00141DA124|nr:mechanosensitive ion channel family protein [Oleiagrimonas sp. C23AA]NII09289.1 mechanosensitive ion channel family protein [Oleiagrimonas sp. C23AA]
MYAWLTHHFLFHIPLDRWLYALLFSVLGYIIVRSILGVLASRLRKLDKHRPTVWLRATAAAFERSSNFLILILFLLLAGKWLDFGSKTDLWLGRLAFLVLGLQVGLWMNQAIRVWTHHRLSSTRDDASKPSANPVVMEMLGWFARIVVWATILLAILGNMGVNITAFVASLGVGGVAVALALQNVLSDLFASLSIGLDKPFEIGNFVVFGDIAGTVEHVGVKTTRIRALSGEQVILGNADMLKNIVHNYGRMDTRRIVFSFGVTYDTPRDKLRLLTGEVQKIVEENDKVRFDRAHFKSFGDSSLDFEVVYTMLDPDYTLFMDTQQAINLAMVDRFDELGVEFAFPSRTLYVSGAVNTRLEKPSSQDDDSADGQEGNERTSAAESES